MITQLDTENADRNLTSQVTVLTHTPSASAAMLCQALVNAGDGTKNLDGTGGAFQLEITVGGNSVQPGPQVVTLGASDTRAAFVSNVFPVPANAEVVVKLLSPNAGDSDVDCTAYLYDVYPVNVASGVIEANAVQIGGTAQSATDLKDFADTGYNPSTHKVAGVVLVDTTTTNSDMRGTDGAYTGTPPTVEEIDTELTSSHGSGAWTSGAAGSGDTTITSSSLDDEGDNMVFQTSGGTPIPDALVRAFLKSEYDAGDYSNVVATATTLDDGTWGPIYLNAGVEYTIEFAKTGYEVATTTITPGA